MKTKPTDATAAPKPEVSQLDKALANIDWEQVVLNGGPPCFHVEDGKFCLRAQRWAGHESLHGSGGLLHFYVSLGDLFEVLELPCCPVHESLLLAGKLKPFDNCIVCTRNHRDELIQDKARLDWLEAARYWCGGITHDGGWRYQLEQGGSAFKGRNLREAIDVAMSPSEVTK